MGSHDLLLLRNKVHATYTVPYLRPEFYNMDRTEETEPRKPRILLYILERSVPTSMLADIQ